MTNEPMSLGDAAVELLDPVTVVSDFMGSAALIVGLCCIFAAFFSYMQYRVNPLATPLSRVITYLVVGIILVCLPYVYLLTDSGIPFPSYKK